ncbi:right-handed parallel beta-helix repeat-containing protein [candidate division KSB1 bacterium]|nr:right-handed parallel beta-helix repeat-containing protein [candidate division KSB1 bacterium]
MAEKDLGLMMWQMRKETCKLILSCWLFCHVHAVFGQSRTVGVLHVGRDQFYAAPSAVAAVARDGDVIEIAAGEYNGDVAVWPQSNLFIRGIDRPHIAANGSQVLGKGTWVFTGDNIVIENIELSGSRVPDGNGAAIRFEGTSITLRDCYIHDNENGFMCGENDQSDVRIESCEFANNGAGDGQTHNIYVGHINSLTVQFSYIHHAKIGHNIKSRARASYITYNRIMDEADGTSSFAIDLPSGGQGFVIGNLIQQGPDTDNDHALSFGAEGLHHQQNELYVINNTFVNDLDSGIFMRIAEGTFVARVINNIFYGDGQLVNGQALLLANLAVAKNRDASSGKSAAFVDVAHYDYRLTAESSAINKGIDPGKVDGYDLKPVAQYIHPLKGQKRLAVGTIDIGAYEYMNVGN